MKLKRPIRRFLLPLAVLIVLLTFLLPSRTQIFAQGTEDRWAGVVSDENGLPLAATITINGVEGEAAADGSFELYVDRADDDRYVINAEMSGYVPVSQIHVGTAIEALDLTLKQAQRFEIDPEQQVSVEDGSGTQISIPAGSLVDADGNPATGPLQLMLYTYDLTQEAMPGDMGGLDSEGQPVALESAGVFYAQFTDAEGNQYNLAPDAQAEISIPVDQSAEWPDIIPLWSYDEAEGVWKEEGQASQTNGRFVGSVTHFSIWNFDVKWSAPACIKLTVDPVFLATNSPIEVKAVLKSPNRVRDLSLTQSTNVLYNLPANAKVNFYMPPSSPTPFASVNTGAPWGGTGIPPHPYDDCNGMLDVEEPEPSAVHGMKYHDLNGNGEKDAGEPGLEGWPITLIDANGNTSTMTTDVDGNYWFMDLPPGNASVVEGQQPGWVQTSPPTVRHTVVLTPGAELEHIDFGNTEPCENPTTERCEAGRQDNFGTSDGSEPSTPSQELLNWAQGRPILTNFDVIPTDRTFLHTFGESDTDTCLSGDCLIVGATLTITLKAGPSYLAWNDTIGFVQNRVTVWNQRIHNLVPGGTWSPGQEATITLDLANLPPNWAGVTNVLAALQDGDLDFYIEDDTGVDSIQLEVDKCCECTPPPPDMVAWWPLDETSGTNAAELIHGNDGTHTNGPTPVLGEFVDNSLSFDGSADYVNVPDDAALNFGTGDLSIDAWIRTNSTDTYEVIVDKRDDTPIGYEFLLYHGKPMFQLATATGWSSYYNINSNDLRDGNWHFVAVTVDRDEVAGGKLYVDGQLIHTFNPIKRSGSITNPAELWIGKHHPGGNYPHELWFDGEIDEVELFNRALDQTEIQAIYDAGSAGKCKCVEPPDNMVAWWHLDEMTGTLAADIAMYPNNGTHFHDPTPVTGKVAGALSFDGISQYVEVPDHPEINFGAAITGTNAGDLSIDAWVKTTDSSGVKKLVDKRTGSWAPGPIQGYSLFLQDGQLSFQLADRIGIPWPCSSTPTHSCTNYVSGVSVADGEWHHLAVTVDRDNPQGGKWYVDGVEVGTPFNPTLQPGSLNNTSPLHIGHRSEVLSGPPFFFNGSIDEIEIFDRVLEAGEIKAIYKAGSSGKCKCIEEEETFDAGVEDDFSTSNGTEPTYRSPGLDTFISHTPGADFDETSVNRFFGQTFEIPTTETRRICDAWLEIRVKPLGTLDYNDTIGLYFVDSNGQRPIPGAAWVRHFGSGNALAGLLSSRWGSSTPVTFNFHLSQLPMADGSVKDIVPILDQLRHLDVVVQDDTAVDYVKLTVAYCCDEKEALYDFGDAPDSTNHFTPTMTTYGGTVQANFPTVFDGDPVPGPKHIAPKAEAWLGEAVSLEEDADLFDDYDTVNNIYPPANVADRDWFDDGVGVDNLALPECGTTVFTYTVNSVGTLSDWYVNAWFDFNHDGDWEDTFECEANDGSAIVVPEWAVQDQSITVTAGGGLQSFTTPTFGAMASPEREMWMRVTLSEAQAATPADGRGPANGFAYGETEDYLLPPQPIEACDLEIRKTRNGDFVAGQNGSYTIVVTNVGTTDCDPTIQVQDLLPTGLTYVSASGTGWSCSNSGASVTCDHNSSLAPGASSSINLTVSVDESALPVTNCAAVQNPDDVNLINNEHCDERVEDGKIHGMKFHDLNGNGVKDPGEPGLEGWTILLEDANGNVISTVTDASGNYWFMDLPPGTYTVSEAFQAGWTQTDPASGSHIVTLAAEEVVENIDFGNWQNSDEWCAVGWDINVFNNDSNTIEVGMRIHNRSGSDATYQVDVVGYPGFVVTDFTLTTPFDASQSPPPVSVANSRSVYVAVFMSPLPIIDGPSGQYQVIVTNEATGHSFGCSAQLWQNDVIGVRPERNVLAKDIVFGAAQEVRFELHNLADREIVANIEIDEMFAVNGDELNIIQLNGQEPGQNVIDQIVVPQGEVVEVPVNVQFDEHVPQGSGDIILFVDVDNDGQVDTATSVMVRSVEVGESIHGMKFHDLDGDGEKDSNEPGVSGWTITLTNASGNVFTTTTDVNGNYWFMDLNPGTYTASEVQQSGWTQTFPTDPGTHTVTLEEDQVVEGIDFGNFREQHILYLPLLAKP